MLTILKTVFPIFIALVFFTSTVQAEVTYVHADHLGSVVAESNSSGAITKRFHYKPFGETIESQQDDVGYTGHKHDVDIGLTYMQARYYDPVLGRFYGNDPIGFRGIHSFNRYAYVNNNPFKYSDPNGEEPVWLFASDIDVKDLAEEKISRAEFKDRELARREAAAVSANFIPVGGGGVAAVNILRLAKVTKGLAVPKNLPKNIHPGQQGKHIPGHNNFTPGRSPLAEGVNPQKLLDGVQSGAHPIVRMTPRGQPVVDFGKTIGQTQGKATQFGIIHHGKNGAHIVPANPVQF
ncbi:MAG: RHS repeat-associated protein [Flavobacteriales bacterium]|jgi:RHS repeat-associated protein